MKILVINGPNINMLGIREPKIYGSQSYQALLQLCQEAAKDAGFAECSCFQSNHEGDLVDAIQDAYGSYDGVVINPGAYTHTSIAILDAAKAVGLPMVEVGGRRGPGVVAFAPQAFGEDYQAIAGGMM